MNRRTFIKSAGAAALLLTPAWRSARAQGFDSIDDAILAGAPERIEQHRKGRAVIAVRDAKGRPIHNASIRLEQTRHEFLFGANLFLFRDDGQWQEEYRRRYAALLNAATLGFYWGSYEPESGRPNYERTDGAVEWCLRNGIQCKGHPLIWDAVGSSPEWLPDDPGQIRRFATLRVREIVARYRGRIDAWDVVNEPSHLGAIKTAVGKWGASVGAVAYVREFLNAARAANPSATLLVNDYRAEPRFFEILEQLRAGRRFLFDAIGMQSHMHFGVWQLHHLWSICANFARLGPPIHFTETTVLSGPRVDKRKWGPTTPGHEAAQADYTERLYTLLFSHPSVAAISWWDLSDLGAWLGAPAGWLRRDMSPKPVYERLLALIKGRWWTNVTGRTTFAGEFKTRVFYGRHNVTVTLPNGRVQQRNIHVKAGKANRFVVMA